MLRGLAGFGMIHDRSEAGICSIPLGSGKKSRAVAYAGERVSKVLIKSHQPTVMETRYLESDSLRLLRGIAEDDAQLLGDRVRPLRSQPLQLCALRGSKDSWE